MWADKLDPRGELVLMPNDKPIKRIEGAMVDTDLTPTKWHPDQRGNVVEVEPLLVTKARHDGIV